MKRKKFIWILVASLAFVHAGCDLIDRLTATDIKEILDHPRKYEDKEVTVYGTVTDSASMLIVKFFEIEDGTGKIKVVTNRVLPAKGEKIKVTGHTSVIEVGSERWVVLREEGRTDKSTKSG